jgi:hypothetical protein
MNNIKTRNGWNIGKPEALGPHAPAAMAPINPNPLTNATANKPAEMPMMADEDDGGRIANERLVAESLAKSKPRKGFTADT